MADSNILDDADMDIHGIDDDNPHLHNRGSPTLPDDEEDDHGPVESGPLMNEVRLAYKKGQVFSSKGTCKY
jgi:hypothetical protein